MAGISSISQSMEFDPALQLNQGDQDLVRTWGGMLDKIAAREQAGFKLDSMTVKGAALIGEGDKRRPIQVMAKITYQTPDGMKSGYHVMFMPDSATLTVVFRVFADNADHMTQIRQTEPIEHQVMIIGQYRYNSGCEALEVPGGILGEGKEFETPKNGALREMLEEGCSRENGGFFPHITPDQIKSLGNPTYIHPSIPEAQHQFYVDVDVSQLQLQEFKEKLNNSRAGCRHEGEETRVMIMPIYEAWRATAEGGFAYPNLALTRYMALKGLLKFGK